MGVRLLTAKIFGGALSKNASFSEYPIPLKIIVTKNAIAYAGTVAAKNNPAEGQKIGQVRPTVSLS